jgi:hypothetical protein
MLRLKPILLFVCGFAVIYGLLLAPWPGWADFYGQYFRDGGNAIFGSNGGERILRFEAHRQTQGLSSIDSRIVLGNHALATSDGKMPVTMLGLDSRGIGWVPTALTIALIVATPIPWQRRTWARISCRFPRNLHSFMATGCRWFGLHLDYAVRSQLLRAGAHLDCRYF